MKRLGVAQVVGASMTFCILRAKAKLATNVEREQGNIELTKTSTATNIIHGLLYVKFAPLMESIRNVEESNTNKVLFINIF